MPLLLVIVNILLQMISKWKLFIDSNIYIYIDNKLLNEWKIFFY